MVVRGLIPGPGLGGTVPKEDMTRLLVTHRVARCGGGGLDLSHVVQLAHRMNKENK